MYDVRHYPRNGFFVVSNEQRETRYFNGRKYQVYRKIDHFVHPHAHKKDFTDHVIYVMQPRSTWSNMIIRHHTTSFGA